MNNRKCKVCCMPIFMDEDKHITQKARAEVWQNAISDGLISTPHFNYYIENSTKVIKVERIINKRRRHD